MVKADPPLLYLDVSLLLLLPSTGVQLDSLVGHGNTRVLRAVLQDAHGSDEGGLLGQDSEGSILLRLERHNGSVGPGAEALISAVEDVLGSVQGQPRRGGGALVSRSDGLERLSVEAEGCHIAAVRGHVEVGGRCLTSEEEGGQDGLVKHCV